MFRPRNPSLISPRRDQTRRKTSKEVFMPDTTQTKPTEKRGKILFQLLEGSKRFFIASVLLGWLSSLLELVSPQLISFIVDSVLGEKAPSLPAPLAGLLARLGGTEALRQKLYIPAVAVVVLALFACAARWAFRMMNAHGQESMLRHTRRKLYLHILRLPLSWHHQNRTGDIIQRCTNDVETIRSFLSDQLITLIRTALQIFLALYFMIGISPRLSIVTAVFIPITILFSLFFHKRIQKSFRVVDEKEGVLSAVAQENLTGVRVVRAFGRESFERERFEKTNEEYTGMWDHLMKLLSAFWASGDVLSGLQRMLILFIGASFCIAGQMTVGQFIAFISYSAMLEWPVRQLGRVISGMSRAGVSIDRIAYILGSEEEAEADIPQGPDMTGDIVFSHVTFGYGEEGDVLKDVSFTAKAGKVTGILGSTGSGKSTLMYLLCRLYDLKDGQGQITVGGHDLAKMDRAYVRSHIGIVQQEPFLFNRTIGENISIGAEGADGSLIREVSGIAQLEETIGNMTQGYDTLVGERGVSLSGGQKQRAAIAQTLILQRPILLMDDSLSAVDTRTDARIRKELAAMPNKPTRILISHRVTTLMDADEIVVLDKGRVVEKGTHQALYAQGGMYRKICDLQSPEGIGGGEA